MLSIRQLEVTHLRGEVPAVKVARVDLEVEAGQGVVLIGDVESGKRELLMATLALELAPTRFAGSVRYREQELLSASSRVLDTVRGNRIALVPQDARAALDPSRRVGEQLQEVLRVHRKMQAPAATEQVLAALRTVHLAEPEACLRQRAGELSQAACQRVMLAMALLCEPELLLLDEPTARLDPSERCELLLLLCELRERGMAMLVSSADLAVAAALADRIAVMYGGRVVEQGPAADIFEHPRHPYTLTLLSLHSEVAPGRTERELTVAAQPPLALEAARGCAYASHCSRRLPECITSLPMFTGTDTHVSACWHAVEASDAVSSAALPERPWDIGEPASAAETLFEAKALEAYDAAGRQRLRGVSFVVSKGQTLGVMGESGSGAALLPEVLLQLVPASAGEVLFHGENLCELAPEELRLQRQYLQGIGPAPWDSIDPLLPMLDVIEEPLRIFRPHTAAIERRERVYSLLGAVGLQPRHLGRFAHELSREEALRVVLARAVILKPDVVVWSEPWSGLDTGARAACSQLLHELRTTLRLTWLLVVSDWRDLRGHCEQMLVLYDGRVVEIGPCEAVYRAPLHPYTRALLEAAPADPLRPCRRSTTSPLAWAARPLPATGCAFREQCPHAIARCEAEMPLLQTSGARRVACHRAAELSQ